VVVCLNLDTRYFTLRFKSYNDCFVHNLPPKFSLGFEFRHMKLTRGASIYLLIILIIYI
jgi:hypothetical protein